MTNSSAPKTITTVDIQPEHNLEVSRIIVHGFQSKFMALTKVDPEELAVFFEQLLGHSAEGLCTKRVVALRGGIVVGTLSLKWHKNSVSITGKAAESAKLSVWKQITGIGTRNTLLLLATLYCLNYDPLPGECYIADLAVHPEHQGKGVGQLLIRRAQQFMQDHPRLTYLSLHVSGNNKAAKSLYERFGFSTQAEEYSLLSKFLSGEVKWEYMICRQYGGSYEQENRN